MSAEQWVSPPFEAMTPHGQAVWLEAYGLGCRDGFTRGWDAHEAQEAALQRWAASIAHSVASRLPYAELCDLRGEPERAAQARERMAAIDESAGWSW